MSRRIEKTYEKTERLARLLVSSEVEEGILHFEALERACQEGVSISNPASVAVYLARIVKHEVSEGDDKSETGSAAYATLLAMYDAGKKRKGFRPTSYEVFCLYHSLQPEVRRAKIVLDNLH